jgi:uncharacterized protein YaiL (DUF2058 family)
MASSLQDQLLKAGVVDKKKAKKSQHQKRKNNNKIRQAEKSGQKVESEQQSKQQQIKDAQSSKRQRDLALNKQRDAEQEKKALQAEVRQIVQQHKVDIPADADIAYNFTHAKKIKKIHVTKEQQKQLTLAQLAIVVLANETAVLPDKIVEKIAIRLPEAVVRVTLDSATTAQEDDPYADYQIPDDLMW